MKFVNNQTMTKTTITCPHAAAPFRAVHLHRCSYSTIPAVGSCIENAATAAAAEDDNDDDNRSL